MPITPRTTEGKDADTPRPTTTAGRRASRKSPTGKAGGIARQNTLTGLALINARFEKEQNLQRYTEEDFKRVFQHFDKDGNGHIDVDELQMVLNELAGCKEGDKDEVPKERVKRMLDKYDTDQNGTIEEDEFVDMMKGTIIDIDMDAQILEAFKLFANKETGKITLATMHKAFQGMGEESHFSKEDVENMIKEVGSAEEGVTYDQFRAMMNDHDDALDD